MLLLRHLFISALFLAVGASAAPEQAIAIGAFRTSEAAEARIAEVKTYLMQDETTAALLSARHFTFTIETVKGLYRSELTGFTKISELPLIMGRVRGAIPDAYYVTPASTAGAAPTPEKDEVVVVDETDTAVQETPEPAPETAAPAADETFTPEAGPAPVSVAPAPVPAASTEVTGSDDLPEPPLDGTSSMLLYSIIVALGVLIVLLFIARRKKHPTDLFPPHEKASLETMAENFVTKQPSRPVAEAPREETFEPEPMIEPEPEEEEFVETSFAETVEPVSETAEPVFEIIEETAEEEQPTMPSEEPGVIPEGAAPRKKRDRPAVQEPVTKERMAEFSGNRILIAEDNLINQKVIARLLEGSGMEVVIVNNGQKALDTLDADPAFNLVLMDAHMPVMDGFEATRAIRQDPRFDAITVVALSGDVGSDDIRKMREAGMEEQLAKPLRVEALYDVLYQYLELAGETETAAEEEPELPSPQAHTASDEPLHAERGLDLCGNDKAMYAEILDEFVSTYEQADNLVRSYLAANDDAKLVAFMLDVKGVASNIGADPLADAAENLREAVLVNQVDDYDSLAGIFTTTLHRTMAAIDSVKATL